MASKASAWPVRSGSASSCPVERVAAVAQSIAVGDPSDPKTASGPIVNQAGFDRILGVIERAKRYGARLVTGGAPHKHHGELAGGYRDSFAVPGRSRRGEANLMVATRSVAASDPAEPETAHSSLMARSVMTGRPAGPGTAHTGRFCCSMYCLTTVSGAPPTVPAK